MFVSGMGSAEGIGGTGVAFEASRGVVFAGVGDGGRGQECDAVVGTGAYRTDARAFGGGGEVLAERLVVAEGVIKVGVGSGGTMGIAGSGGGCEAFGDADAREVCAAREDRGMVEKASREAMIRNLPVM